MRNYTINQVFKKSFWLLGALFLISAFTYQITAQTVFADDFESGNISQWTDTGGLYTKGVTTNPVNNGTYALEMIGSSNNGPNWNNGLGATFPNSQPTTISYSVRTSDTNQGATGYVIILPNGNNMVDCLIWSYFSNGIYRIYANSTNELQFPVSNNMWYDIVLENIDWTAKNYDIRINGSVVATNFPFRNTSLNYVSYIALSNLNGGATSYWDDIDIGGTFVGGNIEVDGSGNLVYNDTDGVDDDLTLAVDGSNYRIGDPNSTLIAGSGATQDGTDVLVPIASVTGSIQINTQDGDDLLDVDFSGGNFPDAISYNGGSQTAAPGDLLSFTGGATFANVTHNFVNENDGSVAITGNATITYTGLEPIIDNLNAVDRVFDFTGGAETITLDAGGSLDNQIDSTLGEMVDFNNPTNSLTINAGTGDDIINIEGVDAAFDADLNINGNDGVNDGILFQANATNIGNGNLTTDSEALIINQDVTTTGSITTTTTDDSIVANATVQSTNGDITMTAGTAPAAGLNYSGLDILNATVQTTGTGNITLTGTGSSNGTGNSHFGVLINQGSTVSTIGASTISIIGVGGNGVSANQGIRMQDTGTTISSVNGAIVLNGTGGNGTGNNNEGITIIFESLVTATGTGTINVTGTSVGGVNANKGIVFYNADVITSGGGITMLGNAGGTGSANDEFTLEGDSNIEDTANGNITITGTGANGVNENIGVDLNGTSSVRSNNGNITFNATGGNGTGNNNRGLRFVGNSSISSTGTGAINILASGGAGVNSNFGVEGNNSTISTAGGGITINGSSTSGTGNSNHGIVIVNNSLITDTANGAISFTGTGANGASGNYGVVFNNAIAQTNSGGITAHGTGGNGTGSFNQGVALHNQAKFEDLLTGNISIT